MREMWDLKTFPRCGSSSYECPLDDMSEDIDPELIRGIVLDCPCQEEEFQKLSERSVIFSQVYEMYEEIECGLPPAIELQDDDFLRHCLVFLKREIESAKNDYMESLRESKETK